MARTLTLVLVSSFLLVPANPVPGGPPPEARPEASIPAGRWKVEYANGVTEICDVQRDGTALVVEPVRIPGKAAVSGPAVLMLFENGRAQRWTPVGSRFVVEHWFPGTQFPTTAAGVLGVAERLS